MAEAIAIVHGVEYPFPDDPDMGDLADMERIAGQGYDFEQGGFLGTVAMAYVAMRRADMQVTVEDIRKLKPPDEIRMKRPGGDASPPEAGANGTSTSASAESSTQSSGDDSEPTPAKTPAPTGTKS